MPRDHRQAREGMVRNQLIPRGITDKNVLRVMGKIERHLFVDEALADEAYSDRPLPIKQKQTISQPYMVALMTQSLALSGKEKTLEIGTGSGYQTAILAELSKDVYTIERITELMEEARTLLNRLGYSNIRYKAFDGTLGWEEYAPYDTIIVTAGAPKIPEPLLQQLADGGRIVVPVGDRFNQELIRVRKEKDKLEEENLGGCRFVDLVGAHGW